MSRRTRTSGRSSRKKGGRIWTANVFNELDPLSTATSQIMVQGGDFAPFEEVTLRTIRGWVHFAPLTTSILDDTVFAAIMVVDEDIGSGDTQLKPSVVANLVDEDILWTGGAFTSHDGNGVLIGGGGAHVEVHVKTMRKIKEGQKVIFAMNNNDGTGEQAVSGMLRTFLTTG